jgi:hypothetical protein
MQTLRRVAGPMNWITFSVAFVELCERFSYYGTTAVCTRANRKDCPLRFADIAQSSTSSNSPCPRALPPVPSLVAPTSLAPWIWASRLRPV